MNATYRTRKLLQTLHLHNFTVKEVNSAATESVLCYVDRRILRSRYAQAFFNSRGIIMKKIAILSLILGSFVFTVPTASANTLASSATAADPQIRVQIGPQRRNNRRVNRRVQTRTYTRIVRQGRNRFREIVRVMYLPNGRTRTQVISRVRIGRYNY